MVNGLLSDMEEEASLCHVAATVRNVPSVKEGNKRTEILSATLLILALSMGGLKQIWVDYAG